MREAPYDEGNVSFCEELLETYTKREDFDLEYGKPCSLSFYSGDLADPATCARVWPPI